MACTVGAQRIRGACKVLSSEDSVRVTVVDDQRLFARGPAEIVDEQPDMEVVGQVHDGEEALALCRKEEPDVVLMDERGA